MSKIRELLANNLKRLRKAHGLTQSEFAEKAKISVRYYQSIEKDKASWPQPEKLDLIVERFQIEPEELFLKSEKSNQTIAITEMSAVIAKQSHKIQDLKTEKEHLLNTIDNLNSTLRDLQKKSKKKKSTA